MSAFAALQRPCDVGTNSHLGEMSTLSGNYFCMELIVSYLESVWKTPQYSDNFALKVKMFGYTNARPVPSHTASDFINLYVKL